MSHLYQIYDNYSKTIATGSCGYMGSNSCEIVKEYTPLVIYCGKSEKPYRYNILDLGQPDSEKIDKALKKHSFECKLTDSK